MTQVQLEQIAVVHGGGRLKLSGDHFVEDGVPAYGAGGRNGYLDIAEYEDCEALILSSIGAHCGKCFHVHGAWTTLANTQVIRPDRSRVDTRFLWYQLNDEGRWPRSGSAQPFIKPADVKAHRVWLPPMEEQRRIAAILDQANMLKRQRQQGLVGLNHLAESVFFSMFGDPRHNPRGWPRKDFAVTMRDATAGSPKVPRSEFRPRGLYPVVDQGQRRVAGYVDDPSLLCPVSEPVVAFGDHTRTVKLIDFPFVLGADGVKVLVPRAPVTATYLAFLLRLAPVQSLGYSRHMRELKRMTFPTPPRGLQVQFTERVAAISSRVVQQERHLAVLRELVECLRRQAFSGRT